MYDLQSHETRFLSIPSSLPHHSPMLTYVHSKAVPPPTQALHPESFHASTQTDVLHQHLTPAFTWDKEAHPS